MTNRGHRIHTVRRSLDVALTAFIGVLLPAGVHAQESATEQPSHASSDIVRVHVVLMVLAHDDQEELEAEFRERQFPSFARAHGLLEVGPDEDPELTLRLQIIRPDKGVDIYMINSTAMYHGEVDTESERACMHCSPADAVADALSNVGRAAAAVVEHRAELDLAPAEPPESIADDAGAPVAGSPRVRILGPASYVGISAGSLGLGAAIAGAMLLDRGKVLESDPGTITLEWTDYRPAGAALMGVGVGAMVVGSVLIGVDLGVLLPRRERAQVLVDGISALTERPGIVVSGRF